MKPIQIKEIVKIVLTGDGHVGKSACGFHMYLGSLLDDTRTVTPTGKDKTRNSSTLQSSNHLNEGDPS
jgi:GTPase SAR1 family protein